MHTLQWLARGVLQLAALLTVAAVPGGSLLLLVPRVRRVAFGKPAPFPAMRGTTLAPAVNSTR